jgi:hypothetical protein
MAATNIMSAPLLPADPFINEYYTPQEAQKPPLEVTTEVTQEVEKETSVEAVSETPQEIPQEVTSEVIQEVPVEAVLETSQETPQEPEEAAQEMPSEVIQDTPIEQKASQPTPVEVVEEASLPSPTTKNKPIIPVRENLSPDERVSFDPAKHIKFTPPSKVWTMQELDYPEGKGISSTGVSEPFPLFSEEAVKQMRAEILSEEVWDKYKYSSNLSHCQLRGYAPE